MVLDEPFLFSVSIRDNIAYGRPDATFDQVVEAARAAGADEFIREMPEGYDTVVGERGFTLSGGQRQRLAIARTLIVNPPILVLDDATSAIDVQIEQQIHAALERLMTGRTTLIIAHRLSTISLADRIAVIEDGRVIAQGTHTELLATEPRYVEILARTEEDARRRAVERDEARADFEREDRRLRGTAADDDVARSRGLDEDLGELADRDPELATHGGTR
jgi:ATP-binding cassette, subfamily B, bacterial